MLTRKEGLPTRLPKSYLNKYRLNISEQKSEVKNIIKLKKPHSFKNEDVEKKPYGYKKAPCKFFIKNACTKGDACTFSHEVKAFPCHAYHLRDKCLRKYCKFSHAPITIEQLKQLKEEEEKEDETYLSLFKENNHI
ncbi:zinc finger protein [Tubulinosema ratisbonensis]|uniref:Zinc finger protein n=1 Tax=Tubulinosema ratisbonensis TaxID=291195 RepID=A0A437AMX0_9MICR|nr:zinc finger protein [Tubulinosema ratisbonensis]